MHNLPVVSFGSGGGGFGWATTGLFIDNLLTRQAKNIIGFGVFAEGFSLRSLSISSEGDCVECIFIASVFAGVFPHSHVPDGDDIAVCHRANSAAHPDANRCWQLLLMLLLMLLLKRLTRMRRIRWRALNLMAKVEDGLCSNGRKEDLQETLCLSSLWVPIGY